MDLEQEKQEQGISLAEIFRILKLNWLLITLITTFALIISAVFSYTFVQDQYKSSTEMLVLMYSGSTVDPENPQYDLINSQRMLETAATLIKSDYILNKLRDANTVEIPEDMTNSQIKSHISVAYSNSSFVMTVTFKHPDQEFAQSMSNELTAIAVSTLKHDFNGNFLKLTDASIPENDTPSKILYTIIGTIGGLVLSIGIVFIKQLFNNSYNSKEELEKGLGLQVLGVIPEFEMKEKK